MNKVNPRCHDNFFGKIIGKRLAGGEGVEPSQSEPESDVLPLDDPPTYMELNSGLECNQDWE